MALSGCAAPRTIDLTAADFTEAEFARTANVTIARKTLILMAEERPSRVAGLFRSLVSRRPAAGSSPESREALRRFLCPSEEPAPAPADPAPPVHDDPERNAALNLVRRLRISAR